MESIIGFFLMLLILSAEAIARSLIMTTPAVYLCHYPHLYLRGCWYEMDDHFTDTTGAVPIFTEEQLDNVCSIYESVRQCISSAFAHCELTEVHYREYQGLDDSYSFICGEGRDDYLYHKSCYSRSDVVSQEDSCMATFIADTEDLPRDPYYSQLTVCSSLNAYLDCVESGTSTLCSQGAALWLRELDTRNLLPSAENLGCLIAPSGYVPCSLLNESTTGTYAHNRLVSTDSPDETSVENFTKRLIITTPAADNQPHPYHIFNKHAADLGILIGISSLIGVLLCIMFTILILLKREKLRKQNTSGTQEGRRDQAGHTVPVSCSSGGEEKINTCISGETDIGWFPPGVCGTDFGQLQPKPDTSTAEVYGNDWLEPPPYTQRLDEKPAPSYSLDHYENQLSQLENQHLTNTKQFDNSNPVLLERQPDMSEQRNHDTENRSALSTHEIETLTY